MSTSSIEANDGQHSRPLAVGKPTAMSSFNVHKRLSDLLF